MTGPMAANRRRLVLRATTAPGGPATSDPVRGGSAGHRGGSQVASALVFFASGAGLVAHVLTDAALPVVFAGLLLGGAVLFARATADPAVRRHVTRLVRAGAVAGVVSTAAYDLARLALVVGFGLPLSPFKALPFFGAALVGADAGSTASWIAGAVFHATNGVCFGVGYTVLAGRRPVVWAVAFGLALEAFMLALYPGWLHVAALEEFTQMSMLGHVAYGLSLGSVTNGSLRERPSEELAA